MTTKGMNHTEKTRLQISKAKRAASGRSTEPLVPQLCACGCGQYAAVDERRNRVSKFVSGHNNPRKGSRHTEETKMKLASYTGEQASSYKHGWAGTPTYNTWTGMKGRCTDPRNASYKYYGALGVTFCDRWKDFVNFLADMGERPEGMTLDRIDPYGNYEPENCRWATRAEQELNKRRHH